MPIVSCALPSGLGLEGPERDSDEFKQPAARAADWAVMSGKALADDAARKMREADAGAP